MTWILSVAVPCVAQVCAALLSAASFQAGLAACAVEDTSGTDEICITHDERVDGARALACRSWGSVPTPAMRREETG